MDSASELPPLTPELPPLTPEQHHALLCKTPVNDKNTALYMLYCFLKRGVDAHMLSSEEITKLNMCIAQFPGLEKIEH